MKRLTVSLIALLVSITALLGRPGSLAASPPPPCPAYDTFIFCEGSCPGNVSNYCLAQLGYPANCRVEQPFCFDMDPYGCPDWQIQIWCPYVPQIP